MSTPSVGVVGASARAAVHSLARAGFAAWAVDQFADRDLKRVAPTALCPLDHYPGALPELAARFPPGPVLYTGGLENQPHIVAELAARRELWGNPPEALARVRDPFSLFPALVACGFAVSRLIAPGQPCPPEGRWLRKPQRSAGGFGIRFGRPGESPSPHHYFQEFIDGVVMSAVYITETLFGSTQQLIGEPWLHTKPFAYCGNIGPITLPTATTDTLARLGATLRALTGLRGAWGLDFVLNGSTPYPVEINPRYTASVEVVEHATEVSLFAARAIDPAPFRSRLVQANRTATGRERDEQTIGKAIHYAPHAITFPQSGPWDADLAGEFDPWRLPGFADIPEAGIVIEQGWPVLSFFATANTPEECRERLQSRAAELDALFTETRT